MAGDTANHRWSQADLIKQRYLVDARAGRMRHGKRTLLTHLMGTRDLLRSWGADEAVQDAGLFHSVLGTTAFAPRLLTLSDLPSLGALVSERSLEIIRLFRQTRGTALVEATDASAHATDAITLDCANLLEQGVCSKWLRIYHDAFIESKLFLLPACAVAVRHALERH